MSEEENNMIIPSWIKPLSKDHEEDKDDKIKPFQNVSYLILNDKILERAFFEGNVARIFRGTTDLLLRTHIAKKPIFAAFYHDFGTEEAPDYSFCYCTEDELKMVNLSSNEPIALEIPFKLEAAYNCENAILLVRSKSDEFYEFSPNTIYSLSHPYGELLPVLCKLKDEDHPSTYYHKRLELVQCQSLSKFVVGFDTQKGVNCVFMVRKCTENERQMGRTDLSVLNRSQMPLSLVGSTQEFNIDHLTPTSSRLLDASTPLPYSFKNRFHTPQGISPMIKKGDKLTENAATFRMLTSVSQKSQSQKPFDFSYANSIISAITGQPETEFDENAVEFILDCTWTDEPNKGVQTPRSPSRLPIIHNRKGSPSAKRAGKTRNKLDKDIWDQWGREHHQAKKATTVFLTKDIVDTDYLVFVCDQANTIKVIEIDPSNGYSMSKPTVFQGCSAAPFVDKKYWILANNNPNSLSLCSGYSKVSDISFQLNPLEHSDIRRFTQLIARNDFQFDVTIEFAQKGAQFIEKRRPRPSFTSPRKRTKSMLDQNVKLDLASVMGPSPSQQTTRNMDLSPTRSMDMSTETFCQSTTVWLNEGFTSSVGKLLLNMVIENLESYQTRLEFVGTYLAKNNYRLIEQNMEKIANVEISLIFEALFEAIGVSGENLPFMKVAEEVRKKQQEEEVSMEMDEKRAKKEEREEEVSDDESEDGNSDLQYLTALLEHAQPVAIQKDQSISVQLINRQSYMTPDELARIFSRLLGYFEQIRQTKRDVTANKNFALLAEPLSFIAQLLSFDDINQYIQENSESTVKYRTPIKFTHSTTIQVPNHNAMDDLTDQMEQSLSLFKPSPIKIVLTEAQKTKLRILPTTEEVAKWVQLRWPTDIRLNNVSSMLDSSQPVVIPEVTRNAQGIPYSDTQIREMQEKFLQNIAIRTVTRAFGSALLNYRSFTAEPTETRITADINLNGKISPSNLNMEYPVGQTPQAKSAHKQFMDWANFFNGVSKGLSNIIAWDETKRHDGDHGDQRFDLNTSDRSRQFRDSFQTDDHNPLIVDWEWLYQQVLSSQDSCPDLAGFILAAGLSGPSLNLNRYQLHQLLSPMDKMVPIALLLGSCVSYRGTANIYLNKVLHAHLPFLLDATLHDIHVNPTVQITSILSLGYLFAESMHTQLTNDLVNQMAKETFFESDPGLERYSYVLTCGFAIGLINVGKGDDLARLELPIHVKHLRMRERLYLLLNGGRRDLIIVNYQRDSCGIAQKGCCSCGMSRTDPRFIPQQHQTHHRPRMEGMHGGAASAGNNAANPANSMAAASSHVAELPTVNIHLSSPAACAALGLIYLRTNDKRVAEKLQIPDGLYQLGMIRSDVIMLRSISKALIMFDSIKESQDWMEAQVPPTLTSYIRNTREHRNIRNDLEIIARAYIYTKAGVCLAMALKYASSWNETVTATIMSAYNELHPTEDSHVYRMVKKAGVNSIESCTNALISALAIVNAGSGNVDLIRLVRKVRNSNVAFFLAPKDSSLYSVHVIANMSLGLLLLGHGRYGLRTDNMSIASMLIAFYPIYGHSILDQRAYFQAFRFLWTLAMEPRFVTTVADGSHKPIESQMEIVFKDENKETLNVKTPYLLPPLESISTIQFKAMGFETVLIDLQNPEELRFFREIVNKMSGRVPMKRSARPPDAYDYDNSYLEPHFDIDKIMDELGAEESMASSAIVDLAQLNSPMRNNIIPPPGNVTPPQASTSENVNQLQE